MNRAILIFIYSFMCLTPGSAQGLPEWLLPARDGRDFYIQGKLHLAEDSTVTEGTVVVKWLKLDTTVYSFRTEKGFFEFFLHPNENYLVIFKHPFTDPKPISFDTHGPQEKGWKKGFALLLDIYLEKMPDDFDRKLLAEPYGRVAFNERSRLFEPDPEYSAQRRVRWEEELSRKRY